jgi:hypothetical protein
VLAYVFSHQAAQGVELPEYEAMLRRFHAALAAAPPAGFAGSTTYRTGGAYCDWYLVESSAGLDALNQAAVSGARLKPHDAVAELAGEGAGKLMTLVAGTHEVTPGYEVRFSKPPGVSYAELRVRLEPWLGGAGVSLWQRMMVLGPPPEFSLISPSKVGLPAEMQPVVLRREPI